MREGTHVRAIHEQILFVLLKVAQYVCASITFAILTLSTLATGSHVPRMGVSRQCAEQLLFVDHISHIVRSNTIPSRKA